MLRYSDLNAAQKKFITNGCGGKGGFINPPEFIFHASCNHHDFYYWRGNNEEWRKKADREFYRLMKIDIKFYKSWLKKTHYYIWAFAYYKSVRLIGKKFFYYGDRMKTLEDLNREMTS